MGKLQEDNDGKHIDDIVNETVCDRHNSERGVACWYVFWSSRHEELGPAICNDRIRSAGYNGDIQPSSLKQRAKSGKTFARP